MSQSRGKSEYVHFTRGEELQYEQVTAIKDERSNEAERERELVDVPGQMSIFDYKEVSDKHAGPKGIFEKGS